MSNVIKKVVFFSVLGTIVLLVYKFSSQVGETSSTYSGFVWNVILFISDRLGISGVVTTYLTEYRVRKLAHITLYFCLSVGATLVVFECVPKYKVTEKQRYGITALISIFLCTMCGCLDEWNQSKLPERGGAIRDVFIDAIGFVSGTILTLLAIKLVKTLIYKWKQSIIRDALGKTRWIE